MIKAVFIDYTGTTVMEGGEEMKQVVMRICRNCTLHEPKEVLQAWWSIIKQYEENSYKDTYLTEEAILDKALGRFVEEYELHENMEELKKLIRGFWVNAPVFPDAKEFYDKCPLPLYVITNNGVQYVSKAMEKNDLHPTGIICADIVRAYKPHRELFEKALEIAGCEPQEVLHIGDSYISDVQGALNAGIRPILVRRKPDGGMEQKAWEENFICVDSLVQALKYIENAL